MTSTESTRQPIYGMTKLAIIFAMISFVIPVVPSVVAFILGAVAKGRLRRAGGDRMNEGLSTLAQAMAVFTLVLVGGFIWYSDRYLTVSMLGL